MNRDVEALGDGSRVVEACHKPFAIKAHSVWKRYGDRTALSGVDIDIDDGEFFGLLGPNGAGKSTMMRLISCTADRDNGTLEVLGLEPRRAGPAIRSLLGVVPQRENLDTELSVKQNLWTYGRFFGIKRSDLSRKIDQLLEFADLTERKNSDVESLSGGMRRRLTIARALINSPKMLLLDEPTSGLDPQSRHALWDKLFELKRRGITAVLTTHYLDEAEQLCDRVAIIDHGQIIARGSPKSLIERHASSDVVEVRFSLGTQSEVESILREGFGRFEVRSGHALIYTDDPGSTFERLRMSTNDLIATAVRRATLEDVFLLLTGRDLAD